MFMVECGRERGRFTLKRRGWKGDKGNEGAGRLERCRI